MKCAQEDALETSEDVLLLPSMAMPYERLRLQTSAMSTRQHSAVMQNGTDDSLWRGYALMETLKKLIGSVSKQLLAVQSNWIPNPSLKQIARVGLRIDGLSNSLQRAVLEARCDLVLVQDIQCVKVLMARIQRGRNWLCCCVLACLARSMW